MENILLSKVAWMAFGFGLLSAVSLPIGAWVGILAKPSQKVTAGVMAFGAGALFAALSFELVGEAIEKLHGGFWPIGLGCILGGLTFVMLNQIISNQGGFLRKTATLVRHLKNRKRRNLTDMIGQLSKIPLFNTLPPAEIHSLLHYVREICYSKGARIITEGEQGFELYIVREGELEVFHDGASIATLGANEIVGEMALLHDEVRKATVIAKIDVSLWEIHKCDFERLLQLYPGLRAHVEQVYLNRKNALDQIHVKANSEDWARQVEKLSEQNYAPSALEIEEVRTEAGAKHSGAPMGIWLGLLLDSIPESAVIGASMVGGAKVSMALIVGLFLANFPEAMSSSVGMKKMGLSNFKINLLWGTLCLITGIGAYFGNVLFQNASIYTVALFESLAAGAMLAMLAETMLPEAFEQGGSVVGICTILGFLAAIFVGTL